MKIKLISNAYIAILIMFFLSACASNNLPKVKNATYEAYSRGDERGYTVKFTLPNTSARPTAIVLNSLEQQIRQDAANQNDYTVNVIAQSRRIFGFKPKKTDKENGIYFQTDSDEIFKPVKFKLITK